MHRHHIKPKVLGGNDFRHNIIELSWLTHYYAHKLLVEENPDNKELQKAFKKMGSIDGYLRKCYKLSKQKGENSSRYGKINTAEANEKDRQAHLGNQNAKGCIRSEETRKKYSESKKGSKNPMFGKHPSDETLKKLSESRKGTRWYNNGEKEVRCHTCPDGYTNGRLKNP